MVPWCGGGGGGGGWARAMLGPRRIRRRCGNIVMDGRHTDMDGSHPEGETTTDGRMRFRPRRDIIKDPRIGIEPIDKDDAAFLNINIIGQTHQNKHR